MIAPRHGTHSLDEITEEARALLELIPNLSYVEGVEVGTLRGKTASILLAHRPGLVLTSVDNFDLGGIVADDEEAVAIALAHNAFPWGDRWHLIREDSIGAAQNPQIPPALDFVYLDAAHDYESTTADIEAWWPRVRAGGILAGHDYGREKPAHIPGEPWGVAQAVHEFLLAEHLALCYLRYTTWAVKKIAAGC